ncbi:SHC SH2 domain-binding protein 1-like [Oppia nitens]|uniref:SHC SH2 domain-binding protein 1-like n=1 Tax=Oppia nitens TaxID=1686743 RepID=UPI0023DB1756|nr:SHC SH2 domain-binding protein 1-like [Oppia nitens]
MDETFVASEESPQVYRIRFKHSELEMFFNDLLSNVTTDEVTKCLVQYVTSSIDPIGWHAIWRTVPNESNGLTSAYDFEVEVMDVLLNRLEAIAVVLKLLNPKESELTVEQFDEKEKLLKETKIVNIPLSELYVISDGDDYNQYQRTAVVIEQIRYFYDFLWRPWDELTKSDVSGQEIFVDSKLMPRLELAFDIKDKKIPQSTINRIKRLMTEAWRIKDKIDSHNSFKSIESMDVSIEDNSEIDYINEVDLVEAIRFKLRLEDIEREMKLLEDKHLRLIASSLKKSTDINGLDDEVMDDKLNKLHIIAKTFTLKSMKEIIDLLINGNNDMDVSIMSHTSLYSALKYVKSGDKIFITTGVYSCPSLPWIESDIEIHGLGANVDEIVIEAMDSVGDIFINCNSNRILFSGLSLKSTSELQSLLMIHKGFVILNDVVLDGDHQTRNALTVLSKAKVELENCKIINEKEEGIITRKGSLIFNRDIEQNLDKSLEHKTLNLHLNLNTGSPSAPSLPSTPSLPTTPSAPSPPDFEIIDP